MRPEAVAKIFEAKERPFFDPLIVHLPSLEWLDQIARTDSPLVAALIAKYWPGPLTLVLPRRAIVPDLVTAGLETVAVRMSGHPVFSAVIQHFGKPLAAPSANRFGRISPTAAEHVLAELGGRIPLVVDGGLPAHGIESTIVAVEGESLRILRSGPITREELAIFAPVHESSNAGSIEAPGQLASHYAPRTPLQLFDADASPAGFAGKRVGLLAWKSASKGDAFVSTEILSPAGDLREAAATLFAKMRRLDSAGLDLIVAEPVAEEGLGRAIMDRLRKAAGSCLTLQSALPAGSTPKRPDGRLGGDVLTRARAGAGSRLRHALWRRPVDGRLHHGV